MEFIHFRELIELFLNTSIHHIKTESETPNINFKFGRDALEIFKDIVANPFIKKGYWTPSAKEDDIKFIFSHMDDDAPTIEIKDSINFFKYLTDIINSLIELFQEYEIRVPERSLAISVLNRIWLRMGIEDITNINAFLERQLQFVKNRTFDTHDICEVSTSSEYDIFMKCDINATWAETTRRIIFTLKRGDSTYELSHVLFDIDELGVCYIYAVQSANKKKDKDIERKLYKLNKNIENPNVHPSKALSMMLFIEELKKRGLSRIRIPSMQILSYRYHELLSKKARIKLEKSKEKLEAYPNSDYVKEQYNYALGWYNRVYKKQDKISYLKTEELINLVYRMLEHDPHLEIINEINLQGDYLELQISKHKKRA